jgi:hypothetical protein
MPAAQIKCSIMLKVATEHSYLVDQQLLNKMTNDSYEY